ncbi:MAG: ribosome biogenesis GTPase Der [Acidobacteria bacterium]|nr:ribosome biogenesis GTPase Der [Acidobacteriota bacterium]
MRTRSESDLERPSLAAEAEPRVAIVGAPNVGKSRLFNRLTGSRSIVHDRPGVTTDRIEGFCEWGGRRYRILDTGGLVPGDPDELTRAVQKQVLRGIEQAQLLLFVVDGRLGMTSLDQALAPILRRSGAKTILVVNKVDVERQEGNLSDFFALGFPEPVPVSAEEGRGIRFLLDRIGSLLPVETADLKPGPQKEETRIRLAIVGRPNVGKSTLFNRICGEDRSVVSRVPGTTRDPVKTEFTHGSRRYQIIDTAGLRRKARSEGEAVEMQGVARALAAIKDADMVLAVLDAAEPATHQDLALIGVCLRTRRPLLVVLNKIDKLGTPNPDEAIRRTRDRLHFSADLPMVAVSALEGVGVKSALALLDRLAEECSRKIPTPALNSALEEAVGRRTPSALDRIPRLYYITQTGTFPPSFVVFTNGARIDTPYRRYLARQIKETLGFQLAPVALRFRQRT